MRLVLSTHQVTLTDAILEHLRSRIEKIEHFNSRVLSASVTLERDHQRFPDKKFSCALRLSLPGRHLFARDRERDLYTAIDMVTKKIEQQIRERHSRFKARKHKIATRLKMALRAIG